MGKLIRSEALMKKYRRQWENMTNPHEKDLIEGLRRTGLSSNNESFKKREQAYKTLTGYHMWQAQTYEEILHENIKNAIRNYAGETILAHIEAGIKVVLRRPYTVGSYYRSSYRTHIAGKYEAQIWECMAFTFESLLFEGGLTDKIRPIGYRDSLTSAVDIAVAIDNKDEKMLAYVEDAIYGENQHATLSHTLINGIMASNDQACYEMLGKLLLAAKGQEGIRQSILEACDMGTVDAHLYFMELVLANDLCRFSASVRAFMTWTGLHYKEPKQKLTEKHLNIAITQLKEGANHDESLTSQDVVVLYMTLWAKGMKEIEDASESALLLINSDEKYKRLVGWYFITHMKRRDLAHKVALQYLHVRDEEELTWVISALSEVYYHYKYGHRNISDYKDLFDEKSIDEQFDALLAVLVYVGKKKIKFENTVFDGHILALDTEKINKLLIIIALLYKKNAHKEQIKNHLSLLSSDVRGGYYLKLLNITDESDREQLFEGLSDKAQYVREDVAETLKRLALTDDEMIKVAKKFTSTSSYFRQALMTVVSKQEDFPTKTAIDYLLNQKNKNLLLAGAELLERHEHLQEAYQIEIDKILALETLATDVRISFERVLLKKDQTVVFGKENGWGLYDVNASAFDFEHALAKRPKIDVIPDKGLLKKRLKDHLMPDLRSLKAAIARINQVYAENLDFEYETKNYNGGRETIVLGAYSYGNIRRMSTGEGIDSYPLADKFKDAMGIYASNRKELVKAIIYMETIKRVSYYGEHASVLQPWIKNIFTGYALEEDKARHEELFNGKRLAVGVIDMFRAMNHTLKDEPIFDFLMQLYVSLVEKIPVDNLKDNIIKNSNPNNPYYGYGSNHKREGICDCYGCYRSPLEIDLLNNLRAELPLKDDGNFGVYFHEMWYQFNAIGRRKVLGLNEIGMFRAHALGHISDDVIYHYLLDSNDHGRVGSLTRSTTTRNGYHYGRNNQELLETYPKIKPILEATIDRIVDVEVNRGELETPLTQIASFIDRFDGGIKHFIKLLVALGEIDFDRGYGWSHTKKGTLSRLIKACLPVVTDTADDLARDIKANKIPEKRLIQAAIYAPQWAKLIEEAAGISGLVSGVWFFHAHANEMFSAQKETEVAYYSAVTPEQFCDGVFDKVWFLSVYETLGEKRFKVLHQNAKYISGSTIHRRAQLYSDAVLGKMDVDALKTEISAKRNQEKLRAFALIPAADKTALLSRYTYIQQFAKESRKFGAQRRASEKKAVEIALQNLAISGDFSDVFRMMWVLEGEKMKELEPLMTKQTVGEYDVWLVIDEFGRPEVKVSKGEKLLKAVPKALAKDELVLELKEAVVELKDQYRRGRLSLEVAMNEQTTFDGLEILGLMNHPILAPLVNKLVFKCLDKNVFGLPCVTETGIALRGIDGRCTAVDTKIRMAHPHDFITAGVWQEWMAELFKHQVVQPFKQVFREYYGLNPDEQMSLTESRRYEGHQVQASKAVALLKNCGWTVDYEVGLQRVYHKENLVVRLFALADWFSPADIEPPTLETVSFSKRDSWETVPLDKVDPILFSEVMRDLDLVVSVAHAGGVDPEASHSTVEMRGAMTKELAMLLGMDNVKLGKAHAEIEGSLGKYTVHLGSGVTHVLGRGAIYIVPVHSQMRGRIFLPFVDEDPKTAEILSKIILLAEDGKIKDPSILQAIKG